jgi:hypothetical protein
MMMTSKEHEEYQALINFFIDVQQVLEDGQRGTKIPMIERAYMNTVEKLEKIKSDLVSKEEI